MYNTDTQLLYLAVLLAKPDLYTKMKSVHKPAFYNPTIKKAAEYIDEYYEEYSSLPDHLLIKTKTAVDIPKLPDVDFAAEQWFTKEYPKFCLHKSLESAIFKSNEELENENYEVVEKIIQEAYEVRLGFDYGLNYDEDPKGRLQNILERSGNISSTFDTIDRKLGKFNAGDLVIYIGGSGTGKSLFLQNHAVNYWQQGKNVLQITLELHPELVARRMDSMLLGLSTKELYQSLDNVAASIAIEKKRNSVRGEMRVKAMPSGSTTSEIKNLIKMYMNDTGKKVDVVIIDYLDLVNPAGSFKVGDTFNKDKLVSEELRNIGQELGPVMISASQLNRSAVGEEDINHSHIAGGISKINTADLVMAIISNASMREKGIYELQAVKVRNGQGTGLKFPLLYNTNTMKISDDPDYLSSINSNMSVQQSNNQLKDSHVNKMVNQLQDALNTDDPNYEPVSKDDDENETKDDRLSQIQDMIKQQGK